MKDKIKIAKEAVQQLRKFVVQGLDPEAFFKEDWQYNQKIGCLFNEKPDVGFVI